MQTFKLAIVNDRVWVDCVEKHPLAMVVKY